jgi:PAS domain S-box-containing protein
MKKILCLLALFLPLNIFSIQNKFSYITSENGLSQGNITFIYQDTKGYLWFGTFSGLNRFDGYKCKVFNFNADDSLSISHERVSNMCEDSEHKFWIGTFGGGVSVYFPEEGNFRRIQKVNTGKREYVLRTIGGVAQGADGNIWVLDENLGLFVFDTKLNFVKSYHHIPNNSKSLPNTSYFDLVVDSKGDTWIGAGNGTLCRLQKDANNFELINFENRVASADDGIRSMYIDKYEKIWIGTTSQGAYCFDPKTLTAVNYRKEDPVNYISGNTVMSFCTDWNGDILIGIDGGGLNILDHKTGRTSVIKYELGNNESLTTNAVYALFVDRSETLWIGTYAGGINYQGHYRFKFRNYAPNPINSNSLSYKNAKTILEDSDGDIWIGTDGGGLNKFDPITNNFTHYRANPVNPKSLHTDVIIHLMQDNEGDIYIGSYNHGLTIFNKSTETFKQYLPEENNPGSIGGMHPWFIFQDSYNDIWVGMLAVGLDKFDKASSTFTHYTANIDVPDMLSNPNIKVIFEDSQRTLWIGTEGGGLHIFNRETNNFARYMFDPDVKGSISNNDIRAIFEDSKGNLWIGTGNGLNLMHRDSIITFEILSTKDGLPNNVINDILEDENGNLWISSNNGITKFNIATRACRNYDISDGLQGNEYNYTAAIKSSTGEFYFGGKNGFNVFRPGDITDNPYKPSIVLTDFQLFNKSIDKIKSKLNGKRQLTNIAEMKEIKLSHKQNVIGFEFSALDFSNPSKNKYMYKLEGFDKEWNEISASKRFASYTNLSGGKYVFRVIGSNSDGLMNEEGLSIKLKVTPPLWQRAWFIILLLLIIGYFVLNYFRTRREKNLREKEVLEEKIKEGLSELEKQKDEVALKDKALQAKMESEKEQNWYNIGMSRMNEVMSSNKDDLFKLSQGIITNVVEYVEAAQGAIYLVNDENEEDKFLELMAAYAPDDKRLKGNRFELQEGQLGAGFSEQRVIIADNLPDNYAHLTSGLGDAPLKHLAIIPLRLNEITIGVIELLAFNAIPQYRIDFVEKAGQTLTSILTSLKANAKTTKLLDAQKMLSEEMAAQEEELRQNLEEMQATQEEIGRMKEIERIKEDERRESEQKLMDQLKEQNEVLIQQQDALKKEEYLFNALLSNAKEHIYFKDRDSKFIRLSHSMLDLFKKKDFSELIGKSDFDFFGEEHARPAFEGEQDIIRSGVPIIDLVEKEVHKDGSFGWVNTSKMPLRDQDGNIVGTWGISKDVTASKLLEESVLKSREKTILCENVFDTIINQMDSSVVVLDNEGKIYKANTGFANSLQKKIDQLIGKVYINMLDNNQQRVLKQNLNKSKKEGMITWSEEEGKDENKKLVNKQLIHVLLEEFKKDYYLLIEG